MKYIKIITVFILLAWVSYSFSQSDAETQLMLAQIKKLQQDTKTDHLQLAQQVQVQVPSPPLPGALPQSQPALPVPPPAAVRPPMPIPPLPPTTQLQTQTQKVITTPSAQTIVTTIAPTTAAPVLQGSLYQNLSAPSSASTQLSGPAQPPQESPINKIPKFEYPYAQAQVSRGGQDKLMANKAFDGAVQGLLPMTPEQIHRLRQIYDSQQFAAASAAGTPPRPTATSVYVNLSPGATPPVIRLADGFVTSMVFLDATGAPWPIEALDIGNPQVFNIQWDKKSNILMIQANSLYTYGNLAIRLRNLNTPVMLTLIPGQEIVDYRVDIMVPGYGPEAKALPIETGLPPTETPMLLQVLGGIPPQGSKALIVTDELGQAWVLGDKMYLRTPYTLLSPGWLATMSSADGTNAYELQRAPMVLMAKNGKMVHVKIEGF